MAKLEFNIDASLILKAYKQGVEDAFIIMTDKFQELETELNLNNIDSGEED